MNELSELLDRNELYDIFKNFAFMTGLGVSLRDLDGKDAMSYYKNGGACIQALRLNLPINYKPCSRGRIIRYFRIYFF